MILLGESIRGRFNGFFLSIIFDGGTVICWMDWNRDGGTPDDDSDERIDDDNDDDIEAIFNS